MGKDQRGKKHGLDTRKNQKIRDQKMSPPPAPPRRRGKGKR